ncbi:hypothetical protein LTR17_022089 [Elasticomyces elasticus]|nr:hypothetical protein LTR17_022089 [Elasticomyces elasticus]
MAFSSDQDFELPPIQHPRVGEASIKRMVQMRDELRMKSKKTVKQLTFGHSAPSTRYSQDLWLARFQAFLSKVLMKQLDQPFSSDDLIRFLSSVITPGVLRIAKGKPGPNDTLLYRGIQILKQYGDFTWGDRFKMTKQDLLRIKVFVHDQVRNGKVTSGLAKKKTWIGFVTLSRMVRAYLTNAIEKGTLSWDITISRCLGVTLVAALGCRAGDVARSGYYKGLEYLRYEHIELTLVDLDPSVESTPTIANVQAIFTLLYTKGKKNQPGEAVRKYLSPLLDEDSLHVCPIHLLLIHALRNGLVVGTNLKEVLANAAHRSDHTIVWTYPSRPVMTLFADLPSRCQLDVAAPTGQLLQTMKELGLVSGLLGRSYTHALRLGGARDLLHVTKSAVDGKETQAFTPDHVRGVLCHSQKAFDSGVTEGYMGELNTDFHQIRAAAKVVHLREPAFAASTDSFLAAYKQPLTEEEIQAQADVGPETPSPTSNVEMDKNQRSVLGKSARRSRLAELQGTVETEAKPSRRNSGAKQQPAPVPAPQTPLAARSVNVPTTTKKRSAEGKAKAQVNDVDLANIDPALLDEDDRARIELPEGVMESLCSAVFTTDADVDVEEDHALVSSSAAFDDEAGRVLLGAESRTEVSTSPSENFVDVYARYNVVKNVNFGTDWAKYDPSKAGSLELTIGKYIPRGNSRDEPTPFTIRCKVTPGCPFFAFVSTWVTKHELICTPAKSEALANDLERIQSIQANTNLDPTSNEENPRMCKTCGWITTCKADNRIKSSINQHQKFYHDWVPKPCEVGCNPDQLIENGVKYGQHMNKFHNAKYPAKCLVPDCPNEDDFPDAKQLNKHLVDIHGLTDADDRREYLPVPPGTKYVPQTCFIDGCTTSTVYESKAKLLLHLQATARGHGLSEEDAIARFEAKAKYAPKVPKKRGNPSNGTALRFMAKLEGTTYSMPAKKLKLHDGGVESTED